MVTAPSSRTEASSASCSAPQLTQDTPRQLHQSGWFPVDILRGASPARAWVLHQQTHWQRIADGLEHAAEGMGQDLTCLVLGDSPHLALLAAQSSHVATVVSALVSWPPTIICWHAKLQHHLADSSPGIATVRCITGVKLVILDPSLLATAREVDHVSKQSPGIAIVATSSGLVLLGHSDCRIVGSCG